MPSYDNVARVRTSNIKKRRVRRLAFFLTCLCMIAVGGLALLKQYNDINNQLAEKQLLTQQIEEAKRKNTELKTQLEYMKTDEYIEGVARDQLGLLYPNEIRFVEDTSAN